MIEQDSPPRSAGAAPERPWTPTLVERTGLADPKCAQPLRASGLGTGARLVLVLVCLGSGLISVTAVVLIIQWIART